MTGMSLVGFLSPQKGEFAMRTRSISSTRNQTSVSATQVAGLGIAHPNATAPVPPAFPNRGANAPHAVVLGEHAANAPSVADEIEASPSFEADFGRSAPAQRSVVEGLRIAGAWSLELSRADAWQAYVTRERELAWNAVMAALAPIMACFESLATRDPTLATRYPALAAFASARRSVAENAARVRKAKARRGKPRASAATPAGGAVTPQAPAGGDHTTQ
jgi:hypothetical protein